MSYKFFCDLETSGSDPIKNGILSACFILTDNNLNILESKTLYVKPPGLNRRTWSIEAQGVHGITYEQAETFMDNELFCYEILKMIGKYKENFPFDFICHASPNGWKRNGEFIIYPWFDWNFLEWAFRKCENSFPDGESFLTKFFKAFGVSSFTIQNEDGTFKHHSRDYKISTVKMARDLGYTGNKLNQWAERLGLNLNHHDAESDTFACYETFKFLSKRQMDNL